MTVVHRSMSYGQSMELGYICFPWGTTECWFFVYALYWLIFNVLSRPWEHHFLYFWYIVVTTNWSHRFWERIIRILPFDSYFWNLLIVCLGVVYLARGVHAEIIRFEIRAVHLDILVESVSILFSSVRCHPFWKQGGSRIITI